MVQHWKRPVFALLARITGQPDAAQTLAQRTFADAQAEISRLRNGDDFERCLIRIATETAIEFLYRSPARVFPALDALAPEKRALLVLAYVENRPTSDLCYIFSVSAASLEARLTEARAALTSGLPAGQALTAA
jgi:DNA-directed RNA polymerase specialized sigma24 family protein